MNKIYFNVSYGRDPTYPFIIKKSTTFYYFNSDAEILMEYPRKRQALRHIEGSKLVLSYD